MASPLRLPELDSALLNLQPDAVVSKALLDALVAARRTGGEAELADAVNAIAVAVVVLETEIIELRKQLLTK